MSNGGFEQQGSVAGMPPELLNLFLRQLGIDPRFGGAGGTIGLPNPQTGQGTFTGQPIPGTAAPTPGGKKQSAIKALTLIAVPVLRALAAGQTGPRRGRNRAFLSTLLAGGAESIATEAARPRRESLENLEALERIARIRASGAQTQAARTRGKADPFKPGTPVKAQNAKGEDVFIQRNTKTGKLEEVPGFGPPTGKKQAGTRQIKERINADGSTSLFIQTKPGSKEFEAVVIVEGEGQAAPAAPAQQVAGFPAGARPAPGQQVAPAAAPAAPAPGGRRVPFVSAAKPVKPTKRSTALVVDESTGLRVLVDTQTGEKIADTGILGRAPKDDKDEERIRTETNALRVITIAIRKLEEEGIAKPSQTQINNKALDLIEARVRRRPKSGAIAAKLRKAVRDITRRKLSKDDLFKLFGLSPRDFITE